MGTYAGALLLAAPAYSYARRYAYDPRFTSRRYVYGLDLPGAWFSLNLRNVPSATLNCS
jgi:hypothetical protein